MIQRWLRRQHVPVAKARDLHRLSVSRGISTSHGSHAAAQSPQDAAETVLARTRNIGIIAHIDAGKTTTTERMLYYSGYTRRIGDVDEGSTVTDFLPAERARGITIQSAAISFQWPPVAAYQDASQQNPPPHSSIPYDINLIDTPGHADFTFEVLRSLRVLDGAVCILDGVAGVEAQTEKVWSQASAYQIPRILYVNKLDRDGAAFGRTIKEVGARLNAWPAVCGIPWCDADGRLIGLGDVVGLRGLRYADCGDGKEIEVFNFQQLRIQDAVLVAELKRARTALVELISEHDDDLVEKFLQAHEDHLAISPADMTASLRRCTLQHPQTVVAVFAGASFRNIGVQPLLDAVVDLLPAPDERPDAEISFGNGGTKAGLSEVSTETLRLDTVASPTRKKAVSKDQANLGLQNLEACALAFKVVADAKRGVLVYIRVYSGAVTRNAALWNTNLRTTERAQRLLKMYANDAVDIDIIPAGQIGVVPGLKFARTGDTLICYTGMHFKIGPPPPINSLQLRPIDVPPPVFFVSVEPNSLSEEKHIKESLDLLLREDPSLHASVDEESGQTHLSGMGELHLEIARDRLVKDLKAKARIGQIEIGYREAITAKSGEIGGIYDRDVGGKIYKAGCNVSVESAVEGNVQVKDDHVHCFEMTNANRLVITTPTVHSNGSRTDSQKSSLPEYLSLGTILQALQTGCSAALVRGPALGYPVHSTQINIMFNPEKHLFPSTTPAALSSSARMAVQKVMKISAALKQITMMEPVMLVTVSVNETSLGSVVHDISSARGGSVVSLGSDESSAPNNSASVEVGNIYAPPDPFAGGSHSSVDSSGVSTGSATRQVVARVPLKEMVGYLKHLRSLTGGRGTFTMVVDTFEKMGGQRMGAVLSEMRGEYG